jgi:hypothetical protein
MDYAQAANWGGEPVQRHEALRQLAVPAPA